jgi:hypothetical protein
MARTVANKRIQSLAKERTGARTPSSRPDAAIGALLHHLGRLLAREYVAILREQEPPQMGPKFRS